MKHSVPHTVGKEMAKKVARAAFDAYAQRYTQYGARATWLNEDQAEIGFSVKGLKLGGKVAVGENAIDVDMDVPFLLRPFQKQAMQVIEEEISKWIGKAQRGEIA